MYLWLPDGTYDFTLSDGETTYRYHAVVDGEDITVDPQPMTVPVTPGVPVFFDTAAEASNALGRAVLTPSTEVAAMFGVDAGAKAAYCAKFAFAVVETSGGKWSVEAVLTPEAWSNVVESAQAATLQLPIAELAAWRTGEDPIFVHLTNCVPGFFYSLFDGAVLTELKADIRDKNCNVLCGAEKTVDLPEVTPPPGGLTSGFFSVGVLEAPSVIPGETETSTNWSAIPRTKEKHDIL